MFSTATSTAKAPSYFSVNTGAILTALQKAGPPTPMNDRDVMVALAQCSGVSRAASSPEKRVSTHGVDAMMKRTGLSRGDVEAALRTLASHNLLKALPVALVGARHADVPRYEIVAALHGDAKLSPDLVQPRQENRLWRKGTIGYLREHIACTPEIPAGLVLLDAISIFLAMHKHQDFAGSGGVPPDIVHGTCKQVRSAVPDHPAYVVMRASQSDLVVDSTFLNQVLQDVDANDSPVTKLDRFHHACRELDRLCLIKKVLVVWNRHPCRSRFKPDIRATLWIDGREEDCELQLADTMDRLVKKLVGHSAAEVKGGKAYLVPREFGEKVETLVQYRACRWGRDELNMSAMHTDAERVRAEERNFETLDFPQVCSSRPG